MSLILSGTDGLSDIDGSAATPAIRGTDANTGIFFGTDIIGFSEGGVEAARINADSQFVAAAGTAALPVITTTGDLNTGIFFPAADTIAFSEGGAEAMRITSAGDVGIGTSSPSGRLNLAVGASTSCTMRFTANNTGSGAGDRGRLDFYSADNSGVAYQLGYMDYDRADGTGTASYIAWASRVSGTVAERMRITSDGKLGVNTSGAAYGGTVFRLGVNDTNYCIAVNATAGGTTDMINFYSSGTFAGKVSSNGATTAYNTSSDYRLKEDITPLTGALTKVSALKPVTFKWKLDRNLGEGFIAHELAEVCPYAVNGEKDEVDSEGNIRAQSIDTSFLVATLTAAIQEQQALITALTARITALEAQNADNPPQGETP